MKKLLLIGNAGEETFRLMGLLGTEFQVIPSQIKYAEAFDKIQKQQPDLIVLYPDKFDHDTVDIIILLRKIHLKFSVLTICESAVWEEGGPFFSRGAFTPLFMPTSDDIILNRCRGLTGDVKFDNEEWYKRYFPGGRKMRILIIDDSTMQLGTTKALLDDRFDVFTAASGKEGLRALEDAEPDIILLDYEMDEMDGVETFKEIRARDGFSDTPIIFMTGVNERDKVLKAAALKPSGYIRKPVKKDILTKQIEEAYIKYAEEKRK